MGNMKLDCKFEPELLQKYVEGTIEPLEKVFVEEHIKVCRSCKKELTEIKLLFWELENIDEGEIEIPAEINNIREAVIDQVLDMETSGDRIKNFISHQKKALESMSTFINFIPGTEQGKKLVKKAPSLIYRASGMAFKGSLKIINSRS